jgi:signal peptide peptidase SppA
MRLIDIVCGPWAIAPQMLLEIQGIYDTHLRGEKINIPDVEARLGRKLDNRHESFQVRDGVAVIPVDGVIAKRMNLLSQISGGASTEMIQRDIEKALADPAVKAIILSIDSPGGTVDGTFELVDYIYQHRGQKPIITFSDGQIASAAYAIGAAADSIWISSDTNMVGSIGVVAAHRDYSRKEQALGIKTTEITSGKYKRMASQYEPLSEEGRADIQAKTDYLYSVFVDTVARNRGVSVETVLTDMADGRVFIGKQNIKAGLVDGVSTLDNLIDQLAAGIIPAKGKNKTKAAAGVVSAKPLAEEVIMTREELQAQHPELVQALLAEGQALASAEHTTVLAAAANEERTRVVALVTAAFGDEPGKKFAAVVERGLSAADLGALGISFAGESAGADVESRKQILDALASSGQQPLGKTEGETKVDASSPIEDRAKAEWDKDGDLRAEFGGKYGAYLAYRKSAEGGRARVLGKK